MNNCKVTGSAFSTTDALSHIKVNGGCFFQNSSGCTESSMVNITTGQPFCNPFIPPGFPRNLSPARVTFNGVNTNCVPAINDRNFIIFPNPSNNLVRVNLPNPNQSFSIEIYSLLGQNILKTSDKTIIDISNFKSGIYIMKLRQENKIWTAKIVSE